MSTFDPLSAQEPQNPYAAPLTDVGIVPSEHGVDDSEAETVRRLYIGHEAAVKSIGMLHYVGVFFGLIGIIGIVVAIVGSLGGDGSTPVIAGVGAIYCALTALNFALGYGLRRLQTWARWTETAFLLFGLLSTVAVMITVFVTNDAAMAIPSIVGVVIYGYVLYLLLSPKGAMVFSPGYKAVIEKTPHIKYTTSWIVKLAVALLLGVIGLAVIAGVIAAIFGAK